MPKIPMLYFTSEDAFAGFVDNNEHVRRALQALAADHRFLVNTLNDVLVIEQGDISHVVPSSLFHGHRLVFKARSLQGPSESVCAGCRRSWDECGGPGSAMAKLQIYTPAMSKTPFTNATAMDISIAAGHHERCGLYPLTDSEPERTLSKQALIDAGFEPWSRPAYFVYSDDIGDGDIEYAHELVERGVDVTAEDAVNPMFKRSWLAMRAKIGGGNNRQAMMSPTINDLVFDHRLVTTNRVIYRVRGAHAGSARRAINKYRREHCANCVYQCLTPPYDLENPRPLSDQDIVRDNYPDALQMQWMAAHRVCGKFGDFRSDKSGRRRKGVGARPVIKDGQVLIRVLSRRPPYEVLTEMRLCEYWDVVARDFDVGRYNDSWPEIHPESRAQLARAHWALKTLHALSLGDEANFVVNDSNGVDRRMRNDVLYIHMTEECDRINIGSDTLASNHGGMNNPGSRIDWDERPRFITTYDHPFTGDIMHWFRKCPGACTGRKLYEDV